MCGVGTYQTGAGVPVPCVKCSVGTYQTGTGKAAAADCALCAAGTFQTGVGMASADNCTACRAGTFSSGAGMANASACSACGPGKYQTGVGRTDPSDCSTCGPGEFLATAGATAAAACAPCAAGTYGGVEGVGRCAECPANSFGPAAAVSAADCVCLRGFRRPAAAANASAACGDVDECADPRTAGACGTRARCVSTAGSFRCDPLPPALGSPPACPDPYPSSCRSAGGTAVWIFAGPGAAAGAARARFVLGGLNQTAAAAPAGGAWIGAECPASGGAARADGVVERTDGSVACAFTVAYAPGPATVTPRAVGLDGGAVRVDLAGFGDPSAAAPSLCAVLFGGTRGPRFTLPGASPAAVDLVAPPQASPGPAALRLQCDSDGPAGPADLGAALEYRRGPALDFAGGAPRCERARACAFAVAVLDPPDAAPDGLRVRLRRADGGGAAAGGAVDAAVQVRCWPCSDSLRALATRRAMGPGRVAARLPMRDSNSPRVGGPARKALTVTC